jgi:hypothetical protein
MNSAPAGQFETFIARIESPALRAVALHWQEARGTGQLPTWVGLGSPAAAPHAKLLWSLAYDPKKGIFTGGFAGDRWRKWIGENFHGRQLKDYHPRSTYLEAQQLLTKIVTTPLAFRSSGRLFTADNLDVTGERIVLPLATDGKTGDGILGASDYAPPPLLGRLEIVHENVEWYAI